jgi:hypothetical protein
LSITTSPAIGYRSGHDVVAALAADQDASHRTRIADALGAASAHDLRRRAIGEVGTVTFARVDHQHARAPRRVEHALARSDDGLQRRDVVAERFAEAAGSTKSRCMSMMRTAVEAGRN